MVQRMDRSSFYYTAESYEGKVMVGFKNRVRLAASFKGAESMAIEKT